VLIPRRTRWLLRRWRWRCSRCGLGIRCIGCGELGPRSRQRRRSRRIGRRACTRRVAGASIRRKAFGARRRRHPRRIRAVALRNHGNRPRRAAVGRPHQRHGVTRRHQRYHLDDAPALRIDDDPDLFTGRINRAQRVSRALAHRTTQGLKSGGAHDGDDLVRRQSCDRIAGAGISRWRGRLRQRVSRYRKRGDKSRAEGDLVFQDRVPPI